MRKYFINIEKVKELGLIEQNVESGKLSNILFRCQERYVKPVLGRELYDKLLEDIKNNTLIGSYKFLVDEYVVNYLIAAVEYKAVFHQNMKLREKGTGRSSDEYVNESDLSSDNDLRDEISKDMSHFKRMLVEYLEQADFSEYKKCKATNLGSNDNPYKFSFITRNR
jgi:hypothetical protein